MSDQIYRLGLMGLVYSRLDSHAVDAGQTPQLLEYLKGQDIPLTEEALRERIQSCFSAVERELDYYDESELKVNILLERYIVQLLEDLSAGTRHSGRDISLMICSLGNKNNDHDSGNAVQKLLDRAHQALNLFHDISDLKDKPAEVFNMTSSTLTYIVKILSLLDVFVTSRLGMLAGLEEYAPTDYNYINPVEVTDWVAGTECNTQEDCPCGCAFDKAFGHPLTLLQGMEDFLNGNESEDRVYFEGVASANGIRLQLYTGNEGPVYDAIKELGRTAYDAVMAAWKAVKDWFDSDGDKEKNKVAESTAEDNKKAIQSMDKTADAEINENAKKGIAALAAKVDPTGAMGKIVARLSNPASAGGVIDGLLGLLSKSSEGGSDLQAEKKKTEEALAELKKAGDSANGDDKNAEAAAATKSGMQEKIKNAKAAVSNAKKKVKEHNRITDGIRKAITGITPHIFVAEGAAATTDEEKNKGNKK